MDGWCSQILMINTLLKIKMHLDLVCLPVQRCSIPLDFPSKSNDFVPTRAPIILSSLPGFFSFLRFLLAFIWKPVSAT